MTDYIRIFTMVEGIIKRPKMYTANGTAEEVLHVFMGLSLVDRNLGDPMLKAIAETYCGPIGGYFPNAFHPAKVLEKMKEEGLTTDEEILDRLMEICKGVHDEHK